MIVELIEKQQLFGGPYSKNIESKNNFPNAIHDIPLLVINKLIISDSTMEISQGQVVKQCCASI